MNDSFMKGAMNSDKNRIELFTFDQGIVTKRDPVFLKDSELVSCSGFKFNTLGKLTCRDPKTKLDTAYISTANIQSIHRYINYVMAVAGKYVYYKWDLNGFCNQYTPIDDSFTYLGELYNSTKPVFADFESFIFLINGFEKKAFTNGYLYNANIPPPIDIPQVIYGTGDNITTEQECCFTYYVLFPNGKVYETAPSPIKEITGTCSPSCSLYWYMGLAANWIFPAPYHGAGTKTYLKLYRKPEGCSDFYYVDTIWDKRQLTYAAGISPAYFYKDDTAESTLITRPILATDSYAQVPDQVVDVEMHLQRLFFIYKNRLYDTEAYMPFVYIDGSNIVITEEEHTLVCVKRWAEQLFIGMAAGWQRLVGDSPSNWAIRNTLSPKGPINKHTVKITDHGIVSLYDDGIYVFDGFNSRSLTENILGKDLFESINKDICFSEYDGTKYYFHYGTGSTVTNCLIIDFSSWPDIQIHEDDFIPTAFEYHAPTQIKYIAKDKYQYEETGSETIATSLRTGDRVFGNKFKRKNLRYLHYEVNTNGKDLSVKIYCDGVLSQTLTINKSSRVQKRKELKNIEGYRFALGIECADSQSLVIYSPWALEATIVGD